jgi:putative ATPase
MDLFMNSSGGDDAGNGGSQAPLAHRMRPRDLDEWLGHERLISPGRPLRQWIDADRVPSLILWGPPGCGKTSFGKLLAKKTQSRFVILSAITAGVKDLKEKGEEARAQLAMYRRKTIVFIDEIHRFNKSQQDALLPYVEEGALTLIGATTENPSFELNSALLSRLRVIRLERLDEAALVSLLERALVDPERGLGGMLQVEREGLEFIAKCSEGDARRALTALESLALMAGSQRLTLDDVVKFLGDSSALTRQPLPYDKSGEEHYNVVSAFIKSIRQNDPHAGLYYLARMIEGGEDPIFIARRLVILASEDVGNADPRGLQVAIAAKDAVEFIGMPEGRIPLAQAVTYLALAPKSRAAYEGIGAALGEVQSSGAQPVPMHLRNAVTKVMKDEGYGAGYGKIRSHLPEKLLGKRFYEPTENGLEKQMKEKLDRLNPSFEA